MDWGGVVIAARRRSGPARDEWVRTVLPGSSGRGEGVQFCAGGIWDWRFGNRLALRRRDRNGDLPNLQSKTPRAVQKHHIR